jgi:multidrug efflux pump
MLELQQRATAIAEADPAVKNIASWIYASSFELFIPLKPLAERKVSTTQVIEQLRARLAAVTELKVALFALPDVRVNTGQSKSQNQLRLWGPEIDELRRWAPRVLDALRMTQGLTDLWTDQDQSGLQADVIIDRLAASRLCVQMQDIQDALNNAFAQRQISTIYTERNQYRVILEIDPQFQQDPRELSRIYVKASGSSADNVQCTGAIASAQATNAATGVGSGIASNEVPLVDAMIAARAVECGQHRVSNVVYGKTFAASEVNRLAVGRGVSSAAIHASTMS